MGGLFGINYLANLILNSLTNAITSTTFVTSTSTITAATIVSCYHTTLFATSTVACRRKRNMYANLLVGDKEYGYVSDKLRRESTKYVDIFNDLFSILWAYYLDILSWTTIETFPNEASHVELGRLLVSSLNEESNKLIAAPVRKQSEPSINRYLRENRKGQQRSISLVTSTITTYSLYVTSSTKTVSTTFAAAGVLSCVPSGFTLCPAVG